MCGSPIRHRSRKLAAPVQQLSSGEEQRTVFTLVFEALSVLAVTQVDEQSLKEDLSLGEMV